MKIVIAIGSNLQDKAGNTSLSVCQRAIKEIEKNKAIKIEKISHWYLTAPVPASDQPDYVNGAILVTTTMNALELLRLLQHVEAKAGRTRKQKNEARILDLDILVCEDQIINEADLTIPHLRMSERAFALYPLRDVYPEWIDPRSGKNVNDLISGVEGQVIRLMKE